MKCIGTFWSHDNTFTHKIDKKMKTFVDMPWYTMSCLWYIYLLSLYLLHPVTRFESISSPLCFLVSGDFFYLYHSIFIIRSLWTSPILWNSHIVTNSGVSFCLDWSEWNRSVGEMNNNNKHNACGCETIESIAICYESDKISELNVDN